MSLENTGEMLTKKEITEIAEKIEGPLLIAISGKTGEVFGMEELIMKESSKIKNLKYK